MTPKRPSSVRALGRSPIFVDASAWIALLNRRDQHHLAARSLIDGCVAASLRLVTTSWTAYEALSVLKSRAGWRSASELWELVKKREAVDLIRVSGGVEDRAVRLFLDFRDKTWGVVDCASLIVMEDLGCREAIAFDHHFVEASRQRGFQLLS